MNITERGMSVQSATPQPMTEHEARKITERIRGIVTSTRDAIEKMQRLLAEAKEGGAHIALGYGEGEWTRYMADLFAEQPLRLPRDQKKEIVGYLAGEGVSARTAAQIADVPRETARRWVAEESGDPNGSPDQPEEAPGEEVEPDPPSAPSRPVTGLDGKTYTRPEPSKPKRRPLTDAFTDKRWAMQKALESLSRLTQDDRFPQNANQVATSNRSDLIRLKDQLELVINRLPEA